MNLQDPTTKHLQLFCSFTTEQLGNYYSDLHKDIFGFRDHEIDYTNREQLIDEIEFLLRYINDFEIAE